MKTFVLEMHFPNGNVVRKHYHAMLLTEARQKAQEEYPQATEVKFVMCW